MIFFFSTAQDSIFRFKGHGRHSAAWVFAAAKLFLVGISNKVLNKLKKKTKEG